MWELILLWSTGEKQTLLFETRGRAELAEESIRAACGEQITWSGINRVTAWTENTDGTKTPTMYGL